MPPAIQLGHAAGTIGGRGAMSAVIPAIAHQAGRTRARHDSGPADEPQRSRIRACEARLSCRRVVISPRHGCVGPSWRTSAKNPALAALPRSPRAGRRSPARRARRARAATPPLPARAARVTRAARTCLASGVARLSTAEWHPQPSLPAARLSPPESLACRRLDGTAEAPRPTPTGLAPPPGPCRDPARVATMRWTAAERRCGAWR